MKIKSGSWPLYQIFFTFFFSLSNTPAIIYLLESLFLWTKLFYALYPEFQIVIYGRNGMSTLSSPYQNSAVLLFENIDV